MKNKSEFESMKQNADILLAMKHGFIEGMEAAKTNDYEFLVNICKDYFETVKRASQVVNIDVSALNVEDTSKTVIRKRGRPKKRKPGRPKKNA